MTVAGVVTLLVLVIGLVALAWVLRRNAAIRAEAREIQRESRMIQLDTQRMRRQGR